MSQQQTERAQPFNHPSNDDVGLQRCIEFEKTDDEQQIAYGAVLVPNRVDLQGDFVSPEVIATLAANFEERVSERDAVPGVMHAVFPDHVSLAENRITTEDETLGSRALPAGSWVQGWKFEHDDLWQLVKDGVLGGYSIGGTLDDTEMHEAGEHPEYVDFPPEVEASLAEWDLEPEEVDIFEIQSGRILEVSTVDFPAVPDATHEAYKSLAKGNPALTSSFIDARLYLESRGHSEEDAKRLAEYLNSEKTQESASWITRAKQFFTRNEGGDDDQTGQSTQTAKSNEKAGRTLSKANIASAMAVHDAALDMLGRSDVAHRRVRFSDDPAHDFDIAGYGQEDSESDESAESDPDTVLEAMDEETLTKQFESLNGRLDDMEEQIKEASGGDDDDEPTVSDVVEAMQALEAKQTEVNEMVQDLKDAGGETHQSKTANREDTGEKSAADILGIPGGGK